MLLGSRTKQINSYGKRSRRVVDAAPVIDRATTNPKLISIFDDLPPAPVWTSVASKMKKREVITKQKSRSPNVVRLLKKKRLSPTLSTVTKQKTGSVARVIGAESCIPDSPEGHGIRTTGPAVIIDSHMRAPLSAFRLNVPGSPAVSQKLAKSRFPSKKGTPSKLGKPFSPFVDVDIIVLDDKGKIVRKERRVSRTSVGASSARHPPSKDVKAGEAGESEPETTSHPRRPKRHIARKRAVIVSDDSDSDEENSSKLIKCSHPGAQMGSKTSNIPHFVPRPAPAYPLPLVPSPILKPRQLTPIRGGRNQRLFEPPSPPSPTTPTDFDFSIDFSNLNMESPSQTQDTYRCEFEVPKYLKPLLEECHQETCGPHNFSAFIESFPFDPITSRGIDDVDVTFRKIGEASYSEVFGIGDVVLKVIPIRDESEVGQSFTPGEEDGPAPSDAKDVRKEIIVTRAMGEVYNGFVKLLKNYVVRGRYPEVLLQLWDEYNEKKGSESIRPDTFKVSQVYAIIVLPNGGPDLEAYTFYNANRTGWRQASSLFWQVAKALAHAEELVSFEHRDLHWGQILVKNIPTQANALKSLTTNQRAKPKGGRVSMDDIAHGVVATVIDLGLSRMDAGDGGDGERVHWTPFDEEIFQGKGDHQFDVYRMMRELTGGIWEEYHPITNVLWLHYLLLKLLHSKDLKPPRKTKITETPLPPSKAEASFTEKDCYDCLVDVENWLSTTIAEIVPSMAKSTAKSKGKRKMQAPYKSSASSGPARAAEIVAYGVKKGWIKASLLS